MSTIQLALLVAAIAGFALFLWLDISSKVFVAFFVMTQCFDLVPQIIFNHFVWDFGAVLLVVPAVQLLFAKPKGPQIRDSSITALKTFLIWLIICLAYSLLVYAYPILDTLKVARQMIIGYASAFVLLRLYQVDMNAFSKFMRWIYIITYAVTVVTVIQYIIGVPLLGGFSFESTAATSYRGALRFIPVFLPFNLVYLWTILSKLFQGERVKTHEQIYGVLTLLAVALTYTRGIYVAVFLSLMLLLFMLQIRGRLKLAPLMILFFILFSGAVAIAAGGWGGRMIDRSISAVNILLGKSEPAEDGSEKSDINTFSGRLHVVEERMALVFDHNPVVGVGFLHENDVPPAMRAGLKYGSIESTKPMLEKYKHGHPYVLALYSVDIGWTEVILNGGFVGLTLFLLFIITFLSSYLRWRKIPPPFAHYRQAFYIQVIMLVILMFDSNPYTNGVQIAAFMIVGYWYCNAMRQPSSGQQVVQPLAKRTAKPHAA